MSGNIKFGFLLAPIVLALLVVTSSCTTIKPLNEKISIDAANPMPREEALSLIVENFKVTPAIPSSKGLAWGWVFKGFWGDGKNEDVANKGLKLFKRNIKKESAGIPGLASGETWYFEKFYNYEQVYVNCVTMDDSPVISLHSHPGKTRFGGYVRYFYFKKEKLDTVLKICNALTSIGAELIDVNAETKYAEAPKVRTPSPLARNWKPSDRIKIAESPPTIAPQPSTPQLPKSKEEDRLRLSAEQGYAEAQFNLGLKYFNGQGVPQDYKEAVRWYRLSAEQGDEGAQNHLETI